MKHWIHAAAASLALGLAGPAAAEDVAGVPIAEHACQRACLEG